MLVARLSEVIGPVDISPIKVIREISDLRQCRNLYICAKCPCIHLHTAYIPWWFRALADRWLFLYGALGIHSTWTWRWPQPQRQRRARIPWLCAHMHIVILIQVPRIYLAFICLCLYACWSHSQSLQISLTHSSLSLARFLQLSLLLLLQTLDCMDSLATSWHVQFRLLKSQYSRYWHPFRTSPWSPWISHLHRELQLSPLPNTQRVTRSFAPSVCNIPIFSRSKCSFGKIISNIY